MADRLANMVQKQKTIKQEFVLSGIGLHTGCQVHVRFKPAPENSGIKFIRVDLPDHPVIEASARNILIDTGIPRCTSIGRGPAVIHTVEHLMSTLCGIGIENLVIEIDANELPGLDGSGLEFLRAIKKAGILEQNAASRYYEIIEPIGVSENGSSIYVVPAKDFKVSYTLDYDNPLLRSQFFSATINGEMFEREIAPCRTFCLEEEANELRARGLGKGADYKNTLVVGKDGIKENKVRFPDEFARHKVVDIVGDLYLLGMPIHGHVFAVKSGHNLNLRLLKKIWEQKEKYQKKTSAVRYELGDRKVIDINGIMKILPHRYPFLLVDRVIEKGKRGIGIKNVTINDGFFQGHFPSRPVMPGVMMIEAMAQVAGVVMLTDEVHHGKVAFFMAVDNVKFRKVVVPGDQLEMEIEVVKEKSRIAQIHATSKVDGELVAEADMVFSFTDAAYLD